MSEEQIATFISVDIEHYVDERVTAGESPEEARSVAENQMAMLFPDGIPAPGQLLYQLFDDEGAPVGFLWIGPPMGEEPGAKYWVWNVEIDEPYRRRGLGRAAMVLAEDAARAQGATELGLSVFGHNPIAHHLYESMGYMTKAVQMRKPL